MFGMLQKAFTNSELNIKMFDAPWNKMIMISNEKELHYKVLLKSIL